MSQDWKKNILLGAGLPAGYQAAGRVLGREEYMRGGEGRLWSDSSFVARSRTPHTTSAVEAEIACGTWTA